MAWADTPLAGRVRGVPRLLRVRRPRTYGEVLWAHLPAACLSAAVLLLPWLKLRLGLSGPPCVVLVLTGVPCLFCGYTRALAAMAGGNLLAAWSTCPLACVVFVFAGVVWLWNTLALITRTRLMPGSILQPLLRPSRAVLVLAAVLVLLNWSYRLWRGLS